MLTRLFLMILFLLVGCTAQEIELALEEAQSGGLVSFVQPNSFQCDIANYNSFSPATGNVSVDGALGDCVWYTESSLFGPNRIYVEYTPTNMSAGNITDQCTLDNGQILDFDYSDLMSPTCTITDPAGGGGGGGFAL